MQKNIKVSFIVPIYNKEKHLKECIDSLINQTLKDIEIIAINDGSTDKTIEILQSHNDERLKIVTQSNQGSSAARNHGIELAQGEYVIFVDADDFVKDDYAEKTYNIAKKHNADMVVTDYYEHYGHTPPHTPRYMKDCVLLTNKQINDKISIVDKNDCLNSILSGRSVKNAIWNKIIKTDIIKKHSFPAGVFLSEDFCITTKNIFLSNKIVKLDEAFYYYRVGDSNMSSIARISYSGFVDFYYVCADITDFLIKTNFNYSQELIKKIQQRKIKRIYIEFLRFYPNLQNENYVKLLTFIKENISEIFEYDEFKKIRLKYKILLKYIHKTDDLNKICKTLILFDKINRLFSRKPKKELL
ncbi:glycosyltransferase, family 2 [Campylobacter pinnipediorum subsp. caledonicus]|uniref:Glycosyltransferase, family 2 n=1 Tax=Campylobacter pinnipediorum subsp. caledonicus TaxID=1874362 RepID=A0A1S6U8X7_9BACT|nr:glycosyltransferase family 2 protein [Campylobacter pinnipediorum]AQW88188.1 glycosyltransferase, family 2 [Campylobacter pinnipediorum subsp. caledonicus]